MATSKLLKPTNVTISIPAGTDLPDQSVSSNCIDKEGDAINALSDQIANIIKTYTLTSVSVVVGKQRILYPNDAPFTNNKVLSIIPQSGNATNQFITTPYNNGFFVDASVGATVDFLVLYY